MKTPALLKVLRHHVSDAIERGEKSAIPGISAAQAAHTHNSLMSDSDIATIGAALFYSSRSTSKEDALVGDCRKAERSLSALIRSHAALVAALEADAEFFESLVNEAMNRVELAPDLRRALNARAIEARAALNAAKP